MATLKLLHVLFIFVWVGSLLMLTRFMGYVSKEAPALQPSMGQIGNGGYQERLGELSRRIYLLVELPSMVLAVGFGLLQLFLKEMNWKNPYLHLKLTAAFLLIVTDVIVGSLIVRKKWNNGTVYKILHSIAGLLLIVVLFAIYILKPMFLAKSGG